MPINIETLVGEIEVAVRSNLNNFDNMYQAVRAIFARDLTGKTAEQQNQYIRWLMSHFGNKTFWVFKVPSARRIQLKAAVAVGQKFSHRSPALMKLVTAGEAVLNKDIAIFKGCFLL